MDLTNYELKLGKTPKSDQHFVKALYTEYVVKALNTE